MHLHFSQWLSRSSHSNASAGALPLIFLMCQWVDTCKISSSEFRFFQSSLKEQRSRRCQKVGSLKDPSVRGFFLLIPTIDLTLTDQSVTSWALWFSPFPEAWNILLVFPTWPCALWDGVMFYIVPFLGDHPTPLLLNLPLTKPVSVALNKTIIAQLSKWAGCSCTDHCVHPFSASLQVIYLCLHRSMFLLYFSSQSGLTFYHGGSRPAIDPSGRACTESPSSIWDNPYISIKMEWPKTQRQWLVGTARMLQRWL